jgi:hypothetical protein
MRQEGQEESLEDDDDHQKPCQIETLKGSRNNDDK